MPDLNHELSPALVSSLLCPVCGARLQISDGGGSLVCEGAVSPRNPQGRIHCFDGASSGYVPLAPRHAGGGDAKDAVRARTAFLRHGYYAPAAEAIAKTVTDYTPASGRVLDAGCGEGYYSDRIATEGFSVMGFDLSKFAVETAARTARARRLADGQSVPDTLYAVGSVFELPVQEGSMDTVVNIFAPCAPAEYARVLKTGGSLIVVGAGEDHLLGLKKILYDDPYLNAPRRDLPKEEDGFWLADTRHVAYTTVVEGAEHIAALFSMTPYYWRTPRDSAERLSHMDRLCTEVAFDILVYRKM